MWSEAGAGFSLWPYHPYHWRDSRGGAAVAEVSEAGEMTHEQWFLEQLPVIERVTGWVCARRGLRGADAEDFASIVKIRLIENEYEVLGKWQGRSSIKTYLTTVINRIYLDFQVQRFGKWRPSAEARRLGPVALRLEQLMFRDGLSFDEACEVLLSDPRIGLNRDDLHAIRVQLPQRTSRRGDLHEHEPVRPESCRDGRRAGRAPGPRRPDVRGDPLLALAAARARPRVRAAALHFGAHRRGCRPRPGGRPEGPLPQERGHREAFATPTSRPRGWGGRRRSCCSRNSTGRRRSPRTRRAQDEDE